MRGFVIVVLSNATVKSRNVLEGGTVLVGNLLFAVLALSYNCSVTFSVQLPSDYYCREASQE